MDTANPRHLLMYDLFKLIVAILLFLLFLWLYFQPASVSELEPTFVPTIPTETSTPTPPTLEPTAELPTVVPSEPTEVADQLAQTPLIIHAPQGDLTAGTIELDGSGPANVTVVVVGDGITYGSTETDVNGDWALAIDIEAGEHVLVAQGTGKDGNPVGESEPITIIVIPRADIEPPAETPPPVTNSPETPPNSSVCGQGQIKRDVYVVNYCETLTGISQRLGLTLEQLLSANPEIKDPNLIFPGQRLIIP